jgi:FMN reductase
MQIVGVLGSVTPPGRMSRALARLLDAAREIGPSVETQLINLADCRLSFADGRPLEQLGDDSARVVAQVAAADGVVFGSPVYRGSMTGALKNLLDLLPVEALRGKPCAILAMGATQHHYLGVDWHLRDVLAWFGALTLPTSVYLSSADFADGELTEGAAGELRALADALSRFTAAAPDLQSTGPTPLAARRS